MDAAASEQSRAISEWSELTIRQLSAHSALDPPLRLRCVWPTGGRTGASTFSTIGAAYRAANTAWGRKCLKSLATVTVEAQTSTPLAT
eukprot:355912-Chlamydomonas_euryale.AAC.5